MVIFAGSLIYIPICSWELWQRSCCHFCFDLHFLSLHKGQGFLQWHVKLFYSMEHVDNKMPSTTKYKACFFSMQTLNTGSLFYATLNAIAYFYMVRLGIIPHFFLLSFLPFSPQLSFFLHHIGMFVGRLHLHYQPDTNACAFVHCNWPILSSTIHCLCSFGMSLLPSGNRKKICCLCWSEVVVYIT